jgi:hypothetical protein
MWKTDPRRYDGKPLLRLLECYALWSIDHLEPRYGQAMEKMTPMLRQLYKVDGDWRQVLTVAVGLPPNFEELTRQMWRKNTELALQNGVTLEPQQFAEMYIDANFGVDRP